MSRIFIGIGSPNNYNEFMIAVSLLFLFTTMGLWITILVDMFKRSVGWGIGGLFFFPLVFFHAFKYYSKPKKTVPVLLIVSVVGMIITIFIPMNRAKNELQPLFAKLSGNPLTCKFGNRVVQADSLNKYFIWCETAQMKYIPYKSADEMVSVFQSTFISPVVDAYKETLGSTPDRALIVGLSNNAGIVACYEIRSPGIVSKAWHTGTEKPCD